MKPGETSGSIIFEPEDDIDIIFDAVDQMELDLTDKVTEDDVERVTELLSEANSGTELKPHDATVALIGLELAIGSNWMRTDKKLAIGQMLNDYHRKLIRPRDSLDV
ncbi:MAG TPA: hypothetical protein VFT49_00445 [Candidatus Saccharimonadales bacterium]|nr:hypothetical protein [Candidatus Saccharimonadales bacterium]